MTEHGNDKVSWISETKGFGTLGIVATHSLICFEPPFFLSVINAGRFCVQLFFILSAYLTFLSLDKNGIPQDFREYLKYLLLKIARLFPLMFIMVLWRFALRCLETKAVPGLYDSIWLDSFFAITFLNGFSYSHINPWGNWYAGILVMFYVLAPALKRFANTSKKTILLFVAAILVDSLSGFLLESHGIDTGWYFYFWFPSQFPVLILGMLFYYFEKESRFMNREIKNSIYTFAFVVVCGFIISKCFHSIMGTHVQYGILLFSFCYLLFEKSEIKPKFDLLKILGDNSYGIYLFHLCLIPVMGGGISKLCIKSNALNYILCYN